mmetsp:Transcript_59581/g.174293  ORF Transcript_59581/g.174293 Transcript_59581/m.174293 type:complete len:287 (-) Transcript_59581:246-1106(-)
MPYTTKAVSMQADGSQSCDSFVAFQAPSLERKTNIGNRVWHAVQAVKTTLLVTCCHKLHVYSCATDLASPTRRHGSIGQRMPLQALAREAMQSSLERMAGRRKRLHTLTPLPVRTCDCLVKNCMVIISTSTIRLRSWLALASLAAGPAQEGAGHQLISVGPNRLLEILAFPMRSSFCRHQTFEAQSEIALNLCRSIYAQFVSPLTYPDLECQFPLGLSRFPFVRPLFPYDCELFRGRQARQHLGPRERIHTASPGPAQALHFARRGGMPQSVCTCRRRARAGWPMR